MGLPPVGLLASVALVVSACSGAASPPAPSLTATDSIAGAPSASPSGASTAASQSPSPANAIDVNDLMYGARYSPAAGSPGGAITIGDWQAPDQLDPYFAGSFASSELFAMTMRSGLVLSADGHYTPDLFQAPLTYDKSVTRDETGNGFTVHASLKPGEEWSDGKRLTMADYKSTHDWVLSQARLGITTLGWEKVDEVTVSSDGLSADFHFGAPFEGWISLIGGLRPLPEHYISTFAVNDGNKAYPLSNAIARAPTNGAFMFTAASSGTVELARNPRYRGGKACQGGSACLDRVTFKVFSNNKQGEIAAFKAGQIDVAEHLEDADYAAIRGVDGSVGKAIVVPSLGYEHFDLNQGADMPPAQAAAYPNKALLDPVVRKAMEQAIDKAELYRVVFPDYPAPDQKICTNGVPGWSYWAAPDDQLSCPTFDPAAANDALDAAGYKIGADGIRIDPKTGRPLSLRHCTSTAAVRKTSAEFLARSFRRIGIRLDLSFAPSTDVLFAGWNDVAPDTKCSLARGNYDTSEYAYALSFDPMSDDYDTYAGERIPSAANGGNGNNTLHVNDQALNAAIEAGRDAIDPQDRLARAYDVQRIVMMDAVYEIALYYRTAVRGVSIKLRDFYPNPGTSTDMWNAQDWYLVQ